MTPLRKGSQIIEPANTTGIARDQEWEKWGAVIQ